MKSLNIRAETKYPKVVVIGGGTGTFTVLTGLKKHPVDITAIVSMSDSGGSTGKLREEYGVLPPGDIRQCLVALSDASDTMRELFSYRFGNGGLHGHSLGNLFIAALEKMTGDFDKAMEVASDILKVRGRVVPVTLEKVNLVIELKNGKKLNDEDAVSNYLLLSRFGIKKISLRGRAKPNPKAISHIRDADIVVIGPGSLYESLIPNFLIPEVAQAVRRSKAHKVYVCNMMNKYGHTDGFTLHDFVKELEWFIAPNVFDAVIYNSEQPSRALVKKYIDEGEPVERGEIPRSAKYEVIERPMLNRGPALHQRFDLVVRSLIRHDPDKLARAIMDSCENTNFDAKGGRT